MFHCYVSPFLEIWIQTEIAGWESTHMFNGKSVGNKGKLSKKLVENWLELFQTSKKVLGESFFILTDYCDLHQASFKFHVVSAKMCNTSQGSQTHVGFAVSEFFVFGPKLLWSGVLFAHAFLQMRSQKCWQKNVFQKKKSYSTYQRIRLYTYLPSHGKNIMAWLMVINPISTKWWNP